MATNIETATPGLDPESASFRRVKPLPKRRRTAALNVVASEYSPAEINSFSFQDPHALAALADLHARPYFSQLNAQQAIRDLFTADSSDPKLLADFTGLYSNSASPAVVPPIPDADDQLESDYVDHLQLPANTKKRKVPGVNRSLSLAADATGSAVNAGLGMANHEPDAQVNEGALQLAAHRLLVDGPEDLDTLNSTIHPAPQEAQAKHTRESLVTKAAMQQKTLINTRKKQFAAVLDDFPEGDSLALEQALSARYPQLDALFDPKASSYVRLSRRGFTRSAKPKSSSQLPQTVYFPTSEFTFSHPCTTSERLASTRREAARLHARFEEELARQAVRAVEAAAKVAAASMEPPPKNRKRAAGSTRTGFPLPPRLDSDSISGDQALFGKGRQKKKKRSHLANASNPHHLRNYVPSRLPQQPPPLTHASLAAANLLSPPPLRFLSAQIPPKRRRRSTASPLVPAPLANPLDEWICASCEYSLFYGDEIGFRRSVRNRKKILSRRRRARERAAAAASGLAPVIPEKNGHHEHPEMDLGANSLPTNPPPQTGVKKDRPMTSADDTLK